MAERILEPQHCSPASLFRQLLGTGHPAGVTGLIVADVEIAAKSGPFWAFAKVG
jgi:hypothetical protein